MDNKEEFKDLLSRVRTTFKLREIPLLIFLVEVVLIRLTNLISFLRPYQLDLILLAIIVWLASTPLFRFLVKKQKTVTGLNNLYLGYNILIELPLMSWMVYFIGGAESIGAILYCFIIVYTSIIFSRKRSLIVISAATLYYSLIVFLPYFNIISYEHPVLFSSGAYQNLNYLTSHLLIVVPTFYLIGIATSIFTNLLKERTKELNKIKEFLEESKNILEIKVNARTKELKELAKSLDIQVKERTIELQNKINDLERFQKLIVDRELRMVELKKEIKNLKKEAEEIKSKK